MKSKKKIKVSVIVPVYNTAEYLNRCLDSILNQTLKDIEIICINDGSTDNSSKILKKYKEKDERIILIEQENRGVSNARNKALNILQGEYFINIDSDDWVKIDYLEKMYRKSKKNNLDMLISDIIFKYEKDQKIIKDLELEDEKVINGREYISYFLTINNMGYTWNKLIKSEIIKKNQISYNEKIFKQEDVDFLLRTSYFMTRIGKINKAFYYYQQGKNNGSTKITLKNLLDRNESYNSLIRFFNNQNEKIIVNMLIREKEIVMFTDLITNNYYILTNHKRSIELVIKEIIENKREWNGRRQIESLKQIFLLNLLKKIDKKYSYLFVRNLFYIYRVKSFFKSGKK